MTKRALISGVTGADGSVLAELPLQENYEVLGVRRPASSINAARVDHLYQDPRESHARFHVHYGDLTYAATVPSAARRR